MRRLALPLAGLLALGCGTPGRNVPVDLEDAPRPTTARLVAHEVGRLLSADPEESRAAERRLLSLDEPSRQALLQHAAVIPDERDPRWLHVLEENHALPELSPEEDLVFLLWKVSRPEPVFEMKAQGRLLDLARAHPDLLLAKLEQGGRGAEAVAVALAMAGEDRAVPLLLARYRAARSLGERRVAVEALTWLVGEERRPRIQGSDQDIARDAAAIETWYRTRAEGGVDDG